MPDVYAGQTSVSTDTVVTGSWDVPGLTVTGTGSLTFDPYVSTVIRSTGNIVVEGTLEMAPSSGDVEHRIQFVEVDEERFVGGGMDPLDTDVGLWCMPSSSLLLRGRRRARWNRDGTSSSWLDGDEIRVAPWEENDFGQLADESPLFAPGSPVPAYRDFRTEVFNLTSNVVVGGTPAGRSHVMLSGTSTAVVEDVRFEYCGPRRTRPANPKKRDTVLGRYGLHIMGMRRPMEVLGCVVVHSGTRGFVAHSSDGIMFTDCVVYDNIGDAFWWDPDDKTTGSLNASTNITYSHCAAFKVGHKEKADRGGEGRLSSFLLGQGGGNKVLDCVAAGVWSDGQSQPAGLYLDENANGKVNDWVVDGFTAHNCEKIGIWAWQNDPGLTKRQQLRNLVAWRNGEVGLEHGAYIVDIDYSGLTLAGNGTLGNGKASQLTVHPGLVATFSNGSVECDGKSPHAVVVRTHKARIKNRPPLVVRDVRISGMTERAVSYQSYQYAGQIDWIRCVVDERELDPTDFDLVALSPDEVIRVQRRDGTAYQLLPDGTYVVLPAFA